MRLTPRIAVIAATATFVTVVTVNPAQAQSTDYVALGDSYASGVGTREYIDDGSSCQRSVHAYPYEMAAQLGANLDFPACSGARVSDVRNEQLGALDSGTDLVTVMVGGNDAGFADVITQCALPWPWTCWDDIDAANSYIRNTLPGSLSTLYGEIRAAAPNADVVVAGYPRLFNGETCNALARISAGEQDELNATADLLANTISGVAADHGFTFVDVRDAFDGHAVCDDTEWVNGLSNPISESYHPNRAGHDGYRSQVQNAVLSAVSPLA